MDIAQSKKFREDQVKLAKLLKAFGHPARIAILELLAKRETCICGDITDELPLAQSTISQHLKALKSAGLITGEVDGVKTCYCLDQKGLKELDQLFQPFLKSLISQNENNCC
jgi:DNA-binding transcriptional ArsR family regulator